MSNALVMPGHRISEYRLIIPLPESLQLAVMQIRRELYERYRIPISVESQPSLTILHCHTYEGMEAKLIDRVQQIATRTQAFQVELQNFASCYPDTIYIQVVTRNPFHELARELRVVKSLTKIPDHDPHFISEPHLLMAEKLKPFQFTRMWMDCEHTQFTGRFMANSLVLLKRSAADVHFEEVSRFAFASVTQFAKQGSLFG
jgi:2'-5' RNA ligase